MKLKLPSMVSTPAYVRALAAANPGVTELDFSDTLVAGASTMREFIKLFPDAQLTGMHGFTLNEYEFVKGLDDDSSGV